MQADNDNLEGGVSGIEDDECAWEALHEAARKAVETCAQQRASLHQFAGREDHREAGSGRADHAATPDLKAIAQ